MDVGAACKESMNKLSLSELKVYQLRSETQNVLSSMVAYMLEKLLFKHNLVLNSSCLDLREMVHRRDDCISRIGYVLQVGVNIP